MSGYDKKAGGRRVLTSFQRGQRGMSGHRKEASERGERTNYRVQIEGQFRQPKKSRERAAHHLVSTERKISQADKTTGARGTYILEST